MKTPVQLLIDRLKEAIDCNPMEPDYTDGLKEAVRLAYSMLGTESSHIKHAWRDGADGVLNRSAGEYVREVYRKDWEEESKLYDL